MFIATPAYREPTEPTKRTAEGIHALHGGVWRILSGCPWVGNARSELAGDFLESGESHMLWLDADIAFDPAIVQTMLDADAALITCTYRQRKKPDTFTVRTLHGEHPIDAPRRLVGGARVLEISDDGLGCCLVKRGVIEHMYAGLPQAGYVNDDGKARVHLFAHGVALIDGVRRAEGEDGAFFRRARALGHKVECLADAVIYHDGVPGRLADYLETEADKEKSMLYNAPPRLWDPDETVEAALRRELRLVADDLRTAHATISEINRISCITMKQIHNPTEASPEIPAS